MHMVARCTGPASVRSLGAASRSIGQAASHVWTSISRRFPTSIYVCGGFDGTNYLTSAERFDPMRGRWEPLPSMSERRGGCATAVLSGQIYVCGGLDSSKYLKSTERYDPVSRCWETLASMRQQRQWAAAAVVGGKIVICGGFDG